jgi:hypothetical protein
LIRADRSCVRNTEDTEKGHREHGESKTVHR